MRRLNVDRMRRYRERTRPRYVWSPEEVQAVLDEMLERVREMCLEDGVEPPRVVNVRGEGWAGQMQRVADPYAPEPTPAQVARLLQAPARPIVLPPDEPGIF